MAEERQLTPAEQVRNLYGEAETQTARAFEQLVSRDSFGELLARVTENVVGLVKIQTDFFDLILRNLRLAGRADITRLARQLARAEDKLELLLQEVERLGEQVDSEAPRARRARSTNGRPGTATRRAGQKSAGKGGGSA